MNSIISLVARSLLGAGFPILSRLAGPLIYLLIFVIVGGTAWWKFEDFKENLREEARKEYVDKVNAETDKRLKELTAEVKQFREDSTKRADAAENQRKLFEAKTADLLGKITNGKLPVTVITEKGECHITPEATQTWNQLQKHLSQSAQ